MTLEKNLVLNCQEAVKFSREPDGLSFFCPIALNNVPLGEDKQCGNNNCKYNYDTPWYIKQPKSNYTKNLSHLKPNGYVE